VTAVANTVGEARGVLTSVVGADITDSLADDEPFFDRGVVDSLHLVEIIEHFQSDLGIGVEGEDLSPENFGSISAMAKFVEAKRADSSSSSD
jgi:acyl carrier protein